MSLETKAKIEFVNFPNENFKTPKIIELYVTKDGIEIPVVLFQKSINENDHYQILENYLKENNINYASLKYNKYYIPSLEGTDYRVIGMGKIKLNFEDKVWADPCEWSINHNTESIKEFISLMNKKFDEMDWMNENEVYKT